MFALATVLYVRSAPGAAPDAINTDTYGHPARGDVIRVNGTFHKVVEVMFDYDSREVRCKCEPWTPPAARRT